VGWASLVKLSPRGREELSLCVCVCVCVCVRERERERERGKRGRVPGTEVEKGEKVYLSVKVSVCVRGVTPTMGVAGGRKVAWPWCGK
jgi:hypothetical protein